MNLSPETLLQTETVLVRKMSLAPHEVAPLHYHTHMFEHIVCLVGEISVLTQLGGETKLLPGQCTSVQPTLQHQVKNPLNTISQYLLTQSGGSYDFSLVSA
jgi:quercetin dioxygenase-like cupin family protein